MKKLSVFLCVIITTITVSGCGQIIPELTEEENKMITTYVANLILDYHSDTKSRLLIEEEQVDILTDQEADEVIDPQIEGSVEESDDADIEVNQEVVEEPDIPNITDIVQVLSHGNCNISIAGYKIMDQYTEEDGFGLVPGQENKLLMVEYEIGNLGSEAESINFFKDNMKCVLTINGQYSSSHKMSILSNDMTTLETTLQPEEVKVVFICFEIPSSMVESIKSLEMSVTTNMGTANITIL